jgi:tetratricopeptide repeat domain protein
MIKVQHIMKQTGMRTGAPSRCGSAMLIFVIFVLTALCGAPTVTADTADQVASEEINSRYRRSLQYYQAGMKDRAMSELREGLSMAIDAGDLPGEAMMSNGIFKICYYEGRVDATAYELMDRALEIYKQLRDSANMVNAYNNLALSAYKSGKKEVAAEYFRNALDMCGKNGIKKAVVQQNMSDMYMSSDPMAALRLLDEAESSFRLAKSEVGDNPDNVRSYFLVLAKRAEASIALGRMDNALADLRAAEKLSGRIERVHVPDALAHLSHIALEMGDSLRAFRLMLGYETMMDSLTRENNANSLQSLLVQFDTERLQQRNEALRLKVQNRNNLITSGVVIALLLLLLSVFLWWKLKSDRRRNHVIQTQQRDIVRYQREAAELRERQMRQDLDAKNRELTSFALNHSAVNEFHNRLYGILSECVGVVESGDKATAAKRIGECAAECRTFGSEILARDFRVYFEKVHPEFFHKLKCRFPQLSQNDLRLCAFLYLGMSTKDISALTCREVRSVESARLRLRKKLGLPSETTLEMFLAKISYLESEESHI